MDDKYFDDDQEYEAGDLRSVAFTAILLTVTTVIVIAGFIPVIKMII
jgi:hypothetical protein